MAVQTRVLSTLPEYDNSTTPPTKIGEARFEIDYDDVTLLLMALRCVNTTSFNVLGIAFRNSDGLLVSHTFPSGATTFVAFPTMGPIAARYPVTLGPGGHVIGIQFRFGGS